jgi:hypothetical protein
VTYLVHPLLTEKIDNACDIGKPASDLKAEWSGDASFDFSLLEKEIWFPAPPNVTRDNYKQLFSELRWDETDGIISFVRLITPLTVRIFTTTNRRFEELDSSSALQGSGGCWTFRIF